MWISHAEEGHYMVIMYAFIAPLPPLEFSITVRFFQFRSNIPQSVSRAGCGPQAASKA